MTYYIVLMDDDGHWDALAQYESYSDAELEHEDYCDKYPYAWIEIVSKGDYEQCK